MTTARLRQHHTAVVATTIIVRLHCTRKVKTIPDFNEARDDGAAVSSAGPYGNHTNKIMHQIPQLTMSVLVSWSLTSLLQHKYGYIRDERSGMESYPYPVKEG